MVDTTEPSREVAKEFIEAVLKQSELLGSWSLAVIGASIVLLAWHVQRQLESASHQDTDQRLKAVLLVPLSIAAQGLSILLMYLAYGQTINIIPDAAFARVEEADQFRTALMESGFNYARILFAVQAVLFFLGIVFIVFFAFYNIGLLRGVKNSQS